MNMKYFCGKLLFWCACISRICNLLCNIFLHKQGLSTNNFHTLPSPFFLKWISQRKIYTLHLTDSEAILVWSQGGVSPLMGSRNETRSSYLKVAKAWKYPKIKEWYFQKTPWKITDLKRNFIILEITHCICSVKNNGISFLLPIKLWMVYAVSVKSIR